VLLRSKKLPTTPGISEKASVETKKRKKGVAGEVVIGEYTLNILFVIERAEERLTLMFSSQLAMTMERSAENSVCI